MAWLVLVAAIGIVSGCTKVLGDYKLAGRQPTPTDAGKEVLPVDIIVTPVEGLQTTEWGGRATFTVVLKTAPRFNVAIALSSSAQNEGTVSPESITFTPANWNAPQTVVVTGQQDDGTMDGNVIYTIQTSPASSDDPHFKGMDPADVTIVNVDDETPGFIVTPVAGLTTTEFGDTATFTVSLTSPPQQFVTVDLSSTRPMEAKVSPSTLAFSPQNFRSPQTVTITGVDDPDSDGPADLSIVTAPAKSGDMNYNGVNMPDVRVVNLDDESPGVIVSPQGGLVTSESGLTSTITIALTGAPTADVSFGFTSSLPKEGTVSPAKVTFTSSNWRAPQTVTVTGVNDDELDGNQLYVIAIAAAETMDERFKNIDPADVDAVNVDNDTAGLIVTPQKGLVTSEDGQAATFTVALAAKPSSEVMIDLTSTAPADGSHNPRRIAFTSLNWNAPQTITVTGLDDGNAADGDVSYQIRGQVDGTNSDADYGLLPGFEVALVNLDNDTPGVHITPLSGLVTTEGGGKASFSVALRSRPTRNVQINLLPSNAEGAVFPPSLVFTPANYAAPQRVTVTGADDMARDGNQRYFILTEPAVSDDDGYKNFDAPDVAVTNVDDDSPGVVVVKSSDTLTTSESGGIATFTVQLRAAPKFDVGINVSSSNTVEAEVSPSILTFTAANWSSPQTVTVTGKDDGIADGSQPYRVVVASTTSSDLDYQGIDAADIVAVNMDDETPAVIVSAQSTPLVTTETGGTATFTVALGSQPMNSVTLIPLSNRATEGTISPATLVFTSVNWRSPQTVTVTGVDDTTADGNQPYAVVFSSAGSTDSGYNSLKPPDVPVVNIDDETKGITVTPTRGLVTNENGATAQFNVVLTAAPDAPVTIALRSSLASEGTVSPGRLVFTPTDWNAPQKVTVTGVNDTAADGARQFQIILDVPMTTDTGYAGIDPSDVDVVNLDNESPGIQIIPPKIATTSESGASTMFGIFLMTAPIETVTVPLFRSNSSECTLSRSSVSFTTANWATPQWVTVTGSDDMGALDGDTPYRITVGPATGGAPYLNRRGSDILLVNLDNDAAGLTVSPPQGATTEGGIATNFTVALTSKPTSIVNIPIASAKPSEGTPLVPSLVFTPDNWNAPQTVTVRGIDDRVVDGDQLYRIVLGPTTTTGDASNPNGDPNYRGKRAPDVIITNLDDDGGAIRVTAAPDLKTTEAGGTAKFTVVLASAPTANVSIPLVSRDTSEGTITDPPSGTLVFTQGNWSVAQTVTVTGAADSDADGSVPYAIRFQPATSMDTRYAERTADDVPLTNVDEDSPGVTITGASNLATTEAGGTATFRMVLNMAPTQGVTFFVKSSNTAEGDVSPKAVMFSVDDWNVPHPVTITGQQDTVADGNQVYLIVIEPAESSDANYAGFVVDPLPVINIDDDAPAAARQRRSSSARPRP